MSNTMAGDAEFKVNRTWDELIDSFGEEWIRGYIRLLYSLMEVA